MALSGEEAIRNTLGALAHPDKSGAPHTSSNRAEMKLRNGPFTGLYRDPTAVT